jgi:hypothetical protein
MGGDRRLYRTRQVASHSDGTAGVATRSSVPDAIDSRPIAPVPSGVVARWKSARLVVGGAGAWKGGHDSFGSA